MYYVSLGCGHVCGVPLDLVCIVGLELGPLILALKHLNGGEETNMEPRPQMMCLIIQDKGLGFIILSLL